MSNLAEKPALHCAREEGKQIGFKHGEEIGLKRGQKIGKEQEKKSPSKS